MFNETMSLAGDASLAYTQNVYSGYNLVGAFPTVLGAVFLLTVIITIATAPKLVGRVIVGYTGLACVGVVWLLGYALFQSMNEVTATVASFLHEIGLLLIQYGLWFAASLPLAYYVGDRIEKMEAAKEAKK